MDVYITNYIKETYVEYIIIYHPDNYIFFQIVELFSHFMEIEFCTSDHNDI